jgi:hypothetical protein
MGQGFLQMFPDIIPVTLDFPSVRVYHWIIFWLWGAIRCHAVPLPTVTRAKVIEQRQAAETQQP